MASRACNGEVDLGTRMKPCYATQNRYFRGYKHPRRQKYAENAREIDKIGPDGPFSRFFEYFGGFRTLRTGKQPENRVSNKGLHPTTHNWLAMPPLSHAPHLSGNVGGSRMNPDVRM